MEMFKMKIKFLATTLLIGFCRVAVTAPPPMPPDLYFAGPASPLLTDTGIFASERVAYSLLEGALQQAEAVIAATSCSNSVGTFDLFVYSEGTVNDPDFNFVTVDSPASTFTLSANLNANNSFRGQTMTIKQAGTGAFKRVPLFNYTAYVSYNARSSIMVMDSISTVKGINGLPDTFQGKVIKDFYRATDSATGLPYVFDWGLQSFSKLNYPVQKYWQRSKALRDDGVVGRTVVVKDRLVGPNSCRIVIDTYGDNNPDYFWQSGTLSISTSLPAPEYPFDF
jgi:hypothetical protein